MPAYYLFTLLDFLFLNFKDRLCLLIRRKDNVVSREKKISLVFFAEIAGIEPASHAVTGRHPSPVDLTSFNGTPDKIRTRTVHSESVVT